MEHYLDTFFYIISLYVIRYSLRFFITLDDSKVLLLKEMEKESKMSIIDFCKFSRITV